LKIIRRSAALLLVMTVCFALSSCGYNPETVGTITDPDGNTIEITCGEYLAAQYETVIQMLNDAGATGDVDIKALMETAYGDGTLGNFITGLVPEVLAQRAVADYVYDKTDYADDLNNRIYYDNYIRNGWATESSNMLQNGISFESYTKYQMQLLKTNALPYIIYAEGGERELSDEFIADFIETSCGRFTYLSLPYRKFGDVTTTDEELKELRKYAEEILAAASSAEVASQVSKKDIIASAAEEYSQKYQNMLGYLQEMSSITYENTLLMKGDGNFTDSQYEQMLAVPVGEYALIDGGDGLYTIVYREELDAENDTPENLLNNIISAVASGDLQDYISEKAAGFSVELDDKAVKYYSADKIVLS